MAETRRVHRATQSGIAFDVLIPGAFYQCVQPGGFSDSLTGIHVPGAKAILDGSTKRTVVGLTEVPDPVQLPHSKIIVEVSEGGKVRSEVEVDFNANDEQPVHEAFQLALATGIMRMVPDEEVEEKYPRAWASRDPHIVWRSENAQKSRPMIEMLKEAEDAGDFAKIADNARKVGAAQENIATTEGALDAPRRPARTRATPPPPPPPKA